MLKNSKSSPAVGCGAPYVLLCGEMKHFLSSFSICSCRGVRDCNGEHFPFLSAAGKEVVTVLHAHFMISAAGCSQVQFLLHHDASSFT